MPHRPPREKDRDPGTEEARALLGMKSADKLARAVEEALPDGPSFDSIAFDHALRGVRVNGLERAVTCLDAYNAIRGYAKALETYVGQVGKAFKEAQRAADKAHEAMKRLRVCRACNGKKGELTKSTARMGGRVWHDCEACDGAGVVLAMALQGKG